MKDEDSAFPFRRDFMGGEISSDGMTLRDYFAAKIAAALVVHYGEDGPHSAAELAYEYADALLKARNGK